MLRVQGRSQPSSDAQVRTPPSDVGGCLLSLALLCYSSGRPSRSGAVRPSARFRQPVGLESYAAERWCGAGGGGAWGRGGAAAGPAPARPRGAHLPPRPALHRRAEDEHESAAPRAAQPVLPRGDARLGGAGAPLHPAADGPGSGCARGGGGGGGRGV